MTSTSIFSITAGIFTAQPAHVFGATLNGDFYLISRLGPSSFSQWQITGAGGAAALVAGSPSLHAWTAGSFLSAGAPQTNDGINDEPTISHYRPASRTPCIVTMAAIPIRSG